MNRLRAQIGIFFVCSFLALIIPFISCQAQVTVTRDKSDWWSILNENFSWPTIDVNTQPLKETNFQIAGVNIEDMDLDEVAAKFGKAAELDRGDASTFRRQRCYLSERGPVRTYLIFETGEVEETFYLFSGGADWVGSDSCVESGIVTSNLATTSGLKLGITRRELTAILGRPSRVVSDRTFYVRQFKQKTTPQELERLRKETSTKTSDAKFHEEYDFLTFTSPSLRDF